MSVQIVTPWHSAAQRDLFLEAWGLSGGEAFLTLQQDRSREGCARTKNRGIQKAIGKGAEVIIVLDDDCFPHEGMTIGEFIEGHLMALEPQGVELIREVTVPASRGTPYFARSVTMPVAASMGFWSEIGDYDACGQLVHGAKHPMMFRKETVHGRYFPLCGMNLAFRASEWPWCRFLDIERFDDIWQGWVWQRKAYADGKCFNLRGPMVRHSRQSNVWANLRAEAVNLEENESAWQRAAVEPLGEYRDFLKRVFPNWGFELDAIQAVDGDR